MQLNLNKRFSHNFSMLLSYTWSHTINTVEPDAPGGDPNDANQLGAFERGDSVLDQRHRAAISGWWKLPQHFIFGGLATLASARRTTSRLDRTLMAMAECRSPGNERQRDWQKYSPRERAL